MGAGKMGRVGRDRMDTTTRKANKQHRIKTELKKVLYVKCTYIVKKETASNGMQKKK
jgi:hypothetical protein